MSRRSRDNRVPFTRVPPTAPLRRSARCRLSIHDEENRPSAIPTQPNLRLCKRCRAPNANVGDYCIECIATSVSVDAATGFLPHSPVSTLPHLGLIVEETAVERLEKEIGQLKREKEQLAEELRQKNEELSSSMAINSMLMSYFNKVDINRGIVENALGKMRKLLHIEDVVDEDDVLDVKARELICPKDNDSVSKYLSL